MKKLNFKAETILNKKFSIDMSGYNAREVDEFFDLIIGDYNVFEELIKTLNEKLEDKNKLIEHNKEELETLKLELDNLKGQLQKTEKASSAEILKKINDLKTEFKSEIATIKKEKEQ